MLYVLSPGLIRELRFQMFILQARADLLDRLVCDGFSDSGDSDSDPAADGDTRVKKAKKTGVLPGQ